MKSTRRDTARPIRRYFLRVLVLQVLELLHGLALNGHHFFLSGFHDALHFPHDILHHERQFLHIRLARGALVEFDDAIDFVLRKRVSISAQINGQQVVPVQHVGSNSGHFRRHAIYDGLAFRRERSGLSAHSAWQYSSWRSFAPSCRRSSAAHLSARASRESTRRSPARCWRQQRPRTSESIPTPSQAV